MESEIHQLLRTLWPNAEVGNPEPLSGGFWASMFKVPVSGQPDGVPPVVVVRFAPQRSMGAKESEVQRAVAAQGFPTPQVWAAGADETRDGWWSIMDFAGGAPLLAGLEGVGVLSRAPSLVSRLPVQLAEVMAALHRVDPAPVSDGVRSVAPEVAWSATAVLDQLRAGADALGRADVVAALDRLGREAPDSGPGVVCHGDLHPFNVLDHDGELVLLDWTGAVVADPCFDVAFTELLLANPPLALPGWLRWAGQGAGRLVARRFVAAYTEANRSVTIERVPWFRALHCARVLIEVDRLRAERGPDAPAHPFVALAPVAARELGAISRLPVRT